MLGGTLLGGAIRLSQAGNPVHHYSFLSTFAQRAVVPEASCVGIRRDVPLRVAALVGCAAMTGVGAVLNRAQVRAGSSVLILGAGGVGLSAVQACRLSGARIVIVVDLVASKREQALTMGATHTVDPAASDVLAAVGALTDGRGVDYAFEAVGLPRLVAMGFDAVRRGGTLVCIGLPPSDAEVTLPGSRLVREEKVVTGSLYGSSRPHLDMPLLLDLHMEGRLQLDRLITRTYGLKQINQAFDDMRSGEVVRGVISFEEEAP
jgi:Zn-dependent alcohol dehydrogenase